MYKPKNIPKKPGIYKMIDKDENILYIGKAKDLSKRVLSYFRTSAKHGPRISKMIEQVNLVETIVVSSEEEALLLENNMIKEHKPKYNVLLRDDKNFLYIKITNEDFPQIELVRKRLKDKAFYIGPKTSSTLIHSSLEMLRKIYPFRTCRMDIKYEENGNVKLSKIDRKTPCLDHHIGICNAPCIGIISPEKYKEIFEDIKSFFKGKLDTVTEKLEKKMFELAKIKRFEQAAKLRDLLKNIEIMKQRQIIIEANDFSNIDVIGLGRYKNKALVKLLVFREGKMISEETIFMDTLEESEDSEIIERFLYQYYPDVTDTPNEVLIPVEIEMNKILDIKIINPKQGRKNELIKLASNNAQISIDREKARFEKVEDENSSEILEGIKTLLNLKRTPERIECFDISHLGGTHTYASMVVFENGLPKTSDYRKFKIKTLENNKIDDFSSLKEALERRFQNLKSKVKTDKSFSKKPELIIIDGGKGQLSSVVEIAKKLKINIPIVSLAKQEEEIFTTTSKISIKLEKNDDRLKLFQRIRDEAHRFAITSNRKARNKSAKESILDTIPGIGSGTKKKLMKKFGSIAGIKSTPEKDIIELIGTSKTLILKEYL